ncbi:MAG: peptidylprolyl isomerase [Verrucomicrobiaceae bacterium]|nr:peptidylprolyl isomerase [Verrucomicrobiaceae bacterium]
MQIGPDCVVSIHYELTNDAGEVLDTSADGEPLTYLQGAHNIIPGLEQALVGHKVGDQLKVTVQPEDGYGVKQPDMVQEVPRDAFPDPDSIELGMRFTAQSEHGDVSVEVTAVSASHVTVDGNHPLAGQVLHFAVTIDEVRTATQEELDHGHVHAHGHHH